jgi:thiosulfate sulfurtransferase
MYKVVEPTEAHDLIREGPVTIVDIRDPASFDKGHLKNARQLVTDDVEEFIRDTDLTQPLLVYCYHGISSQPAASYFEEQGFQDVYHLAGGFEAWSSGDFPTCSN